MAAKVTSRLSSDTDNETDRLLGSQRNDQLKLVANDVNSNNSSDLQPVSNNMKQTASSREGKRELFRRFSKVFPMQHTYSIIS